MQQFKTTVTRMRDTLNLKKGQDRRGTFETIAIGVSYGGGQTVSGPKGIGLQLNHSRGV